MRPHPALTPLLASAALVSACGNAPRDDAFVLRDSAGVLIAENRWSEDMPLARWRLADVPEFSVGDAPLSPEYELYRVYYARQFDDGRVAVALNTGEVRIFDAAGKHLVTMGRPGAGPGEFESLWDAHPVGDTLIRAFDLGPLRRLTFFDARTGELLRTLTNETPFVNPNGSQRLGDGGYAGMVSVVVDSLTMERAYHLARWSPDGQKVDTLSTAFRAGWRPPENALVRHNPTFGSAAAGDFIYGGWRGRYEIHRYRLDGTLDRIIRSTFEGIPVTEDMKGEPVAVELPPGASLPPTWYPERLPPYSKTLASPGGWLWVRRYASPLEEEWNVWDVFDPDGRLTAQIQTPLNARVAEIGDDWVLGLFRNEMDVETVKRFRVVREEGGAQLE